MTQKKFKEAKLLWREIDRLDSLIKQIENKITTNPHISDYGYLINLLGVDNVLNSMRTRKSILEKEFEKL